MPAPTHRYHAFISYARQDNRDQGRHWAVWLHQALETFEVPAALAGRRTPVGPVPESLAPAYLSTAEPPPDGSLDAATREALKESRVLIVVCSPHAAASRAVAEEVRYFKQLGRERVFALLVSGDPDAGEETRHLQCYPETLRHDVRRDGSLDLEWRVHPAAADVRFELGAEGYTSVAALRDALEADGVPRDRAAERALAYAGKLEAGRRKIIAGVLGVPVPVLSGPASGGELRSARIGQRILFATMLLFMAAAGVACWFAWQKNEQMIESDASRRRTEGVIKSLQSELSASHSAARQMPLLAAANQTITEHFSLAVLRTADPSTLSALADALADGAEIALARSDMPRAIDLARQAIETRERAASMQAPLSSAAQTAIADQRRLARALQRAGKKTDALKAAQKARDLATDVSQRNPGDGDALLALVEASYGLGDLLSDATRQDEAARIVEEAYSATLKSKDPRAERATAQGEARLGRMSQQKGDFSAALVRFRAWEKIIQPLSQARPADAALQEELATAKNWIGSALSLMRQFPEAAAAQRQALELWDGLARTDSTNPATQAEHITALRRLAESLIAAGPENRTEALTLIQRGLDLVSSRFPEKSDPRASALRADLERAQKQAMQ